MRAATTLALVIASTSVTARAEHLALSVEGHIGALVPTDVNTDLSDDRRWGVTARAGTAKLAFVLGWDDLGFDEVREAYLGNTANYIYTYGTHARRIRVGGEYIGRADDRLFASVGLGAAFARYEQVAVVASWLEHRPMATYRETVTHSTQYKRGVFLGGRVGVELYRPTRHTAFAVAGSLTLVIVGNTRDEDYVRFPRESLTAALGLSFGWY